MLINCVAYQDGYKVADIPVTAIREYMSRPNGFVWVALADPDLGVMLALPGPTAVTTPPA